IMVGKLINFDIAKDGISTVEQKVETELVDEIESQTQKILDNLLSEMDKFAETAIDQSDAKYKDCLKRYANGVALADLPVQSQENIEDKKIVWENLKIKTNIEEAFKSIEIEKASVESALIDAENALAEFEKSIEAEFANNGSLIDGLNGKIGEYKKILEIKKGENRNLKESIESLKKTNADIESENRVLAAELKIEKRELEFVEKRFLSERAELQEKIEELQKRLESIGKEAEMLKKEKVDIEFQYLQSKKEFERADGLNIAIKQELEVKNQVIESKEVAIQAKDIELQNRDFEIRKIEEKAYQNDAIQLNKIHLLEDKIAQDSARYSQESVHYSKIIDSLEEAIVQNSANYSETLEDLQGKLSDAMNLAHAMEIEKHEALDAASRVQKEINSIQKELKLAKNEAISLNGQIDDLKAKLSDAQKQKEQLIANKLNSTLQVKRDSYVEQIPNRSKIFRAAFIVLPIFIILLLVYLLFAYYYKAPVIQKALKAEITSLTTELDSKSEYIESITAEQNELKSKVSALNDKLKIFEADKAEALKELTKLQKEATAPLAAAVATPTATPFLLSNQLIGSIYFESGSSSLSQNEITKIKAIAEKYNTNPYVFIRLEGHTDNTMFRIPIFHSNNLSLSIARAAEVSRILVQYGMDTKQISIVGLSDMYPIMPNDNPENREKNRRVEIKVTGKP
ncbi:MAG: OmpA family protein, partial [Desulfamplus sp.]|nr:OmpA family protein [Desulfamplus sp.]